MSRQKKEGVNYYLTEISADSAKAISASCETLANLVVGKLDNMESIVAAAYKKRTGEDMPDNALEQVRNALKTIQYVGWDSTYGLPNKNVHLYSKASDTMFDVMEVLNYQLGQDFEEYKDSPYPQHWNEELPLCRIVRTNSSRKNRNKQLKIFPSDPD